MLNSFWEIPSFWWQASTVLTGVASAFSLLMGVICLGGCCTTYVIYAESARIIGAIQLICAIILFLGIAIYPVGWENREVREACGNFSGIYKLGKAFPSYLE